MRRQDPDLEAWIALGHIPGLGNASIRRLLSAFGSPQAALAATPSQLKPVVGDKAALALAGGPDPAAVKRTLEWAANPENCLLTLGDPAYPQALLNTSDPPPALFVKGNAGLLNSPCFAVVGSRNATPHGLANAEAFARALSERGLTIVSGLALGIDAAAHRGGLAGRAKSVAVTGTGLDVVYPARNRELAHQLAEEGALISEFPLGTGAKAENFPRRNRILSGLSLGVLVVEAALQSGSLITARLGAEQGREVFAIPGSIHSPLSKGCHALIKQGAKLVETAQDVLEELGLGDPAAAAQATEPTGTEASAVLRTLGYDPVDLDSLVQRTGLTTSQVTAELLRLELDRWVASLPGGLYQRLR